MLCASRQGARAAAAALAVLVDLRAGLGWCWACGAKPGLARLGRGPPFMGSRGSQVLRCMCARGGCPAGVSQRVRLSY